MRFIFVFIFFVACNVADIIGNTRGEFIVKLQGDTLWGKNEFKTGLFSNGIILIESDTLNPDSIYIVSNAKSYHKRAPAKIGGGLLERTHHGGMVNKFGYWRGTLTVPKKIEFYDISNSEIKEITYKNIKGDFWKFEESRRDIESFEFDKKYQFYFIGGGLATCILGGFISNSAGYPKTGYAISVGGAMVFFTGLFYLFGKEVNLTNAIDSYLGIKGEIRK